MAKHVPPPFGCAPDWLGGSKLFEKLFDKLFETGHPVVASRARSRFRCHEFRRGKKETYGSRDNRFRGGMGSEHVGKSVLGKAYSVVVVVIPPFDDGEGRRSLPGYHLSLPLSVSHLDLLLNVLCGHRMALPGIRLRRTVGAFRGWCVVDCSVTFAHWVYAFLCGVSVCDCPAKGRCSPVPEVPEVLARVCELPFTPVHLGRTVHHGAFVGDGHKCAACNATFPPAGHLSSILVSLCGSETVGSSDILFRSFRDGWQVTG
ncbi:hypothetical protein ZHAS_00000530 [Anopheles sinensis]|uniref:Uncharacterized protein n=1 Tax=Anopheles sinensis TaxID=74873 RepID=A0A084VA81_ANOSI|nr:hypothetical protein ZHAS_00000530 [Anopheles sinensis]